MVMNYEDQADDAGLQILVWASHSRASALPPVAVLPKDQYNLGFDKDYDLHTFWRRLHVKNLWLSELGLEPIRPTHDIPLIA